MFLSRSLSQNASHLHCPHYQNSAELVLSVSTEIAEGRILDRDRQRVANSVKGRQCSVGQCGPHTLIVHTAFGLVLHQTATSFKPPYCVWPVQCAMTKAVCHIHCLAIHCSTFAPLKVTSVHCSPVEGHSRRPQGRHQSI